MIFGFCEIFIFVFVQQTKYLLHTGFDPGRVTIRVLGSPLAYFVSNTYTFKSQYIYIKLKLGHKSESAERVKLNLSFKTWHNKIFKYIQILKYIPEHYLQI